MRFRYAPRPLPMVLASLFFGACLLFYVYRAAHNDRGLVIDGLVELETGGATIFYAVLAACSGAFVLMGLWGLINRLRRPSYLCFEADALSIPSRWSKKTRLVPYVAVRAVERVEISGQRLLQLTTSTGKVAVAGIMLASEAELDSVAQELDRRIKAAAAKLN